MTKELKLQIKAKRRLYRAYKKTTSDSDWEEYKRQRNHVCTLLKNAKSNYVNLATSETAKASAYTEANQNVHGNNAPRLEISFDPPRLHQLLRCLLKQREASIPDLICPQNGTLF